LACGRKWFAIHGFGSSARDLIVVLEIFLKQLPADLEARRERQRSSGSQCLHGSIVDLHLDCGAEVGYQWRILSFAIAIVATFFWAAEGGKSAGKRIAS
jgi:hypothetical protein